MRTAVLNLTVEKMVDFVNKNQMKFDNAVQRPFVWDLDRQSYLLDSIMRGFPIGVIHVDKVSGETKKDWCYDVMDGQQRCTTLFRFMNNEFELQNVNPFEFDGKEYDVNGLTFEDLPEELQREIRGYALNVVYCENATQDEKSELFRKLNNGKALTSAQSILASIKNFDNVNKLGEHEIFKTLLTAKGQADKKHIMYIAKIWTMLNTEDIGKVSFVSKEFYPKMEHARMSDEELAEVAEILDYMALVLGVANEEIEKSGKGSPYKKIFNKIKKEVHFVSLVPFTKEAIDKGVPASQFFKFCADFLYFNPNALYVKKSQSDTSKTQQITDRHNTLKAAWEDYFAKYGIEPEVKVTVITPEQSKDSEPEEKITADTVMELINETLSDESPVPEKKAV